MEIQDSRLERQIEFIREVDQLKGVWRQTFLMDSSRKENSAEHSWELAVMALVLGEYVEDDINLVRVLKMLAIHDLVEIDAGDTYAYDEEARRNQMDRERDAADRIFGLLPVDQEEEFRALWEEFEARETPEAQFAQALDNLQPLIHNYCTGGESWKDHDVDEAKVVNRNLSIREGSERLWRLAKRLIQTATERGMLQPEEKKAGEKERGEGGR